MRTTVLLLGIGMATAGCSGQAPAPTAAVASSAPASAVPATPAATVVQSPVSAGPWPSPTPTAPPLPRVARSIYQEFVAWRDRYAGPIDAAIARQDWPAVRDLAAAAAIGPLPFGSRGLSGLTPYACYSAAASAWDDAMEAIIDNASRWPSGYVTETGPFPSRIGAGDVTLPWKTTLAQWGRAKAMTADCAGADEAVPSGPREFWDPQPPPAYRTYRRWNGAGLQPDVWLASVAAWDAGRRERVAAYGIAVKKGSAAEASKAARDLAGWDQSFARFVYFEVGEGTCYNAGGMVASAESGAGVALAYARAWASKDAKRQVWTLDRTYFGRGIDIGPDASVPTSEGAVVAACGPVEQG